MLDPDSEIQVLIQFWIRTTAATVGGEGSTNVIRVYRHRGSAAAEEIVSKIKHGVVGSNTI